MRIIDSTPTHPQHNNNSTNDSKSTANTTNRGDFEDQGDAAGEQPATQGDGTKHILDNSSSNDNTPKDAAFANKRDASAIAIDNKDNESGKGCALI